jgi:putative membrane protein insertion efficiency factor
MESAHNEPIMRIRKAVRRFLIFLVRVYQLILSPYLGRQCRFIPTCSNYFIEAVEKHGSIHGGAMGVWRVLRCHPLAQGGYDPVP